MDNLQNTEPIITEQASPEQVVTEQVTVTETGPVFRSEESKKGKGMLLGLVLCLLLAVGGIGFGVWAMMDGNARADKLNKQITNLNSQIVALQEQIEEKDNDGGQQVELNGDIALDLLRKKVSESEYGAAYDVAYANVYAKYNGTDKVSYWVKYFPTNNQNSEVMMANDIIFTLNDDEWEFELPGFTGYGPDLLEQYTVLRAE